MTPQGNGAKHTPRTEKPRGRRKTVIGYVVSDKMQKTIVVELEDRASTRSTARSSAPPRRSRRTTRTAIAGIGDRVSLMETRPTSATKRWRLVEVLEKAK